MDSIDKYIEWVGTSIEKYKFLSDSIDKPDVTLSEVLQLSGKRTSTAFTLTSEYQRYKVLHKRKLKEYTIWWSGRFSEIRKELNPSSLPGSKFSSKSDIEAEIISRYTDKYSSFQDSIIDLENQVDFYRNIRDNWKGLQQDITNIVKLIQLEGINSPSIDPTS